MPFSPRRPVRRAYAPVRAAGRPSARTTRAYPARASSGTPPPDPGDENGILTEDGLFYLVVEGGAEYLTVEVA
jgi:hypothetical protein